jgi:hypothetical protein
MLLAKNRAYACFEEQFWQENKHVYANHPVENKFRIHLLNFLPKSGLLFVEMRDWLIRVDANEVPARARLAR